MRSASTASIGIRGQTQTDTLITSEGSVAVYIDNVVLPRQIGLRSSLFDIESVQILKGSQGTLFGKNTIGGAVIITTRKPVYESHVSIEGTVGEFNRRDVRAMLNMPLARLMWQLRQLSTRIGTRDPRWLMSWLMGLTLVAESPVRRAACSAGRE